MSNNQTEALIPFIGKKDKCDKRSKIVIQSQKLKKKKRIERKEYFY
jgi:hypothetical protein